MRVLVTGGAGFIGTHLVNHLIKHNYDVIVMDNVPTNYVLPCSCSQACILVWPDGYQGVSTLDYV